MSRNYWGNTISTSFTIDLSTIDKKVDKLIKYLENCQIDLRYDGLAFIAFDPTYETLITALKNSSYKESLSKFVKDIYLNRFLSTAQGLEQKNIQLLEEARSELQWDPKGFEVVRFDEWMKSKMD